MSCSTEVTIPLRLPPCLAEARCILLLRTAQWAVMRPLLDLFAEHEVAVTLLLQSDSTQPLDCWPNVTPLRIRPGLLRPSRIGHRLLRRLHSQPFDAILIPFNDENGDGYGNTIAIAPLLTPAPAFGIGSDGSAREVSHRFRTTLPSALAVYTAYRLARVLSTLLMALTTIGLFLFFGTLRAASRVGFHGR